MSTVTTSGGVSLLLVIHRQGLGPKHRLHRQYADSRSRISNQGHRQPIQPAKSLGEHHPSRHYCGVPDCPFALSLPASIARARSQGVPLQRTGTPTDHARVDPRTFPAPVYVQVRLSLLGFDRMLWGDLEHFTSQVEHRYYHKVTGQPMFSVNFGGSIGVRELRVSDTEPVSAVRRTLHFDVGDGSGTTTRVHSGLMAQGAGIP
jgi:hypothetical protein